MINSDFHRAIALENTEAMLNFLQNGVPIDVQDDRGNTLLHSAVLSGAIDIIKLLLEKGAQIDMQDRCGYTPLHLAVIYERIDIIKLLLERGAQVDILDAEDTTPLSIAAAIGHAEIVKLLLENNAHLDIKDKNSQTPFFYAVERRKNEVVKIFLKELIKTPVLRNKVDFEQLQQDHPFINELWGSPEIREFEEKTLSEDKMAMLLAKLSLSNDKEFSSDIVKADDFSGRPQASEAPGAHEQHSQQPEEVIGEDYADNPEVELFNMAFDVIHVPYLAIQRSGSKRLRERDDDIMDEPAEKKRRIGNGGIS